MSVKRRYLVVSGAVLALAGGGAGVASAVGGDEGEKGATGPAAKRAEREALAITQGGHANAVERDDENGASWEVEVTKTDGKTVDVRLDENYQRVVVEGDGGP